MSTDILERPRGPVEVSDQLRDADSAGALDFGAGGTPALLLAGGTPVLLRACADCEKEQGILDRSDARKSHGHCRRHWLRLVRQTGCSRAEIEGTLAAMGPAAFCEDLGVES